MVINLNIYLFICWRSKKNLIKGFKNLLISSIEQTSHFKELLAWNSCRISKLWLGFSRKVANLFLRLSSCNHE